MGGGGSSQPAAQYNSSLPSYRNHASNTRADHSVFASPTESEFSEIYDAPDAIRYAWPCSGSTLDYRTNFCRHWDEDKVADWLKRISCAQYVDLFKRKSRAWEC